MSALATIDLKPGEKMQSRSMIRNRNGVGRRASDLHSTTGDVDYDQRVVGDQSTGCPNLGGEEVCGSNQVPSITPGRPTLLSG